MHPSWGVCGIPPAWGLTTAPGPLGCVHWGRCMWGLMPNVGVASCPILRRITFWGAIKLTLGGSMLCMQCWPWRQACMLPVQDHALTYGLWPKTLDP